MSKLESHHLNLKLNIGSARNISRAYKELSGGHHRRADHLARAQEVEVITSIPMLSVTGSTTSTSSQPASLVQSSSLIAAGRT